MFNMLIKLMVWNVHGASNKLAAIKKLIKVNDPSVLVLMETHVSGEQADKVCSRTGFLMYTRVEALGLSGGILKRMGRPHGFSQLSMQVLTQLYVKIYGINLK
ncbi:putative RNA-directed DNA polymerase from transposon X-element [Bienertia sinuspersici]